MTGLIDPPTMEQLARVVHGTVNKELDRVVRVAVELSGADTRSMNISWSLVIASLILGCALLVLADSLHRTPSLLTTLAMVGFAVTVSCGLLRLLWTHRRKNSAK